jgi:WD40 repeat protein
MDYKQKYLKYKQKYLKLLKDQKGGEPFLSDVLASLAFSWLFAKHQRQFKLIFSGKQLQPMPPLGNITLNHKLRLKIIRGDGLCALLVLRLKLVDFRFIKVIMSRANKVPISDPTCVATLLGYSNRLTSTSVAYHSVTSVAFHSRDNVMAIGISDNTVKLWRLSADCTSATCVAILPGPISLTGSSNRVTSVTFHPIDKILAIGYEHYIATVLHMSDDYTRVKYNKLTLVGHRQCVSSVAFHPREQEPLLATGSWDSTVKLWRLNPPTCVATLQGHSGWITSVVFHPSEHVLATGSYDGTAKLWRMSTDCTVAWCVATLTGHSHPVTSVVFHPSLNILATGSEDRTAKLWRLSAKCTTATCVATLDHSIGGHDRSVFSIAFHPSLPFLATGSDDNTTKVWLISADGTAATCIATLQGHAGTVSSVAFHPIEKVLATGNRDGTAKLWK